VFKRCTRWEEVVHTALEHARWNLQLGTPAEFVLLNPLSPGGTLEEGIDFQRVDPTGADGPKGGEVQLATLEKMLHSTAPRGATPLTDRLRKIRNRILPEGREIARRGQKVILVIATDGLPTPVRGGGATRAEMHALGEELRRNSAELPIHQVVRLCTNESSVVNFYTSLDEEMEVELEVIDDMQGEAKEIQSVGNRWLVYSPLIHRLREGGTFLKVLDLLDERRLEPMEVCLVCQLLLRPSADDPPLPTEPEEFCQAARELLPRLPRVFCPLRLAMLPPVDINELECSVLQRGKLRRSCGDCEVRYCRQM